MLKCRLPCIHFHENVILRVFSYKLLLVLACILQQFGSRNFLKLTVAAVEVHLRRGEVFKICLVWRNIFVEDKSLFGVLLPNNVFHQMGENVFCYTCMEVIFVTVTTTSNFISLLWQTFRHYNKSLYCVTFVKSINKNKSLYLKNFINILYNVLTLLLTLDKCLFFKKLYSTHQWTTGKHFS